MTRAPLLVAALLTATASAASAAPAPTAPNPDPKPFKASFIGEGGGYKASDPATDDYLQGGLHAGPDGAPPAAAPKPRPAPAPAGPAAPVPAPAPAAPVAQRPSPRPAAPASVAPASVAAGLRAPARRATAAAAAPSDAPAVPAARVSLWNGLVKPLDMAASDAADADPAAARAAGDRDYETHILGMAAGPARPALADPRAPAAAPAPEALVAGASAPEAGRVFVTLTLDAREAGTLRDAVAGLGSAAGFTADPRFEMAAAPGGQTLLSGWLPASRLADALSRPGVKRLSLEPRARPARPREAASPYLIGLRLSDPRRARASVDEGVKVLSDATGFRLSRVVGLETGPDGRAVAVVAGDLPISRLSRAMGLSQVAKIVPDGAPAPAAPAPAPRRGLAGFGRFALDRGPWLIVLTLLLALPSIREPLRRAVSVLDPYR